MIVHRLTVNGKDYFLTEPVDELRREVLAAVQAGGGYVTVPGIHGGPGAQILFSPGVSVTWVEMEVAETPADERWTDHGMLDPFDI